MAVIVPIAADYDPSGVQKAQAGFAQFGQSISKTLQIAGRDARKAFADVEQGAQDSTSAAQRLAAQIDKTANTLDADLKASKAAADALARALGPEFVAKVGQGGVNKLVGDLNRAGVSIKEITTEADTLAAAIRRVDDVNLQAVTAETANLQTGVAQVNTQVTAGRQVFASFSGQATTELANVGGSLGAVASGMGQVIAQSVAGRVSLLDFAKTAGPMLALSVVLLEVKSVFEDIKKAKAFRKEEVKAYTDALIGTSSATQAVRDRIDEVGGAFVQVNKKVSALSPNGLLRTIVGIPLPIARETKNVTEDLVTLGLKAGDVAKIIGGGRGNVDKYVAALEAAGVSSTRVGNVQDYLTQQLDLVADAEKAAAVATEFGVKQTREQASAMDTTAIAAGAAAVVVAQKTAADEAAAAAAQAAAQADQQQAAGIDAVREALFRRNNARYAATDADLAAKQALDEYTKAQDKANKTGKSADIEKAADLARAAERATNSAAAAAANLAGETRSYASEADQSRAKTAAAAAEFEHLQELIKPGSALYRALEQYIFLVKSIPAEVVTRFGISFGSAVTTANATPSNALTVLDTFAQNAGRTGNAGVTNITNITVNGAVDANSTARQIDEITTRQQQRTGLAP